MKKNFAEPEMEVVRFNAKEIVTATSGSTGDIGGGSTSGGANPGLPIVPIGKS